jgi:hypothetical protein
MHHDPETLRRTYYVQGVLEYVSAEYDELPLPDHLSDEMMFYILECYESMVCYPNAAGKFCELFREATK